MTCSTESSLADVPAGTVFAIERVDGVPELRRQFYRLGFLPGTEVRVVRCMPCGGPVEVEVRGARVAVRRRDAACLLGDRRPADCAVDRLAPRASFGVVAEADLSGT